MRLLYFEAPAGIAGDMCLAALVGLGVEPAFIESRLQGLGPIRLRFQPVVKAGVSALKLEIEAQSPQFDHHHYRDIEKLIDQAGLEEAERDLAQAIFKALAVAEGAIHGVALEKVHFHEVGAIDSIVDIVGTAIAINALKPDQILFSPIALGYGEVAISHGRYPVPALATLELLKGLPVYGGNHPVELTTPTGAAIAKTLAQGFSPGMPLMSLEKIGYGAGTRDLKDQPNVLRVSLGLSR